LLDERDWYSYTYKATRCKRGLSIFCCVQYEETLATAKGAEGILSYPTRGNLWQSKTYDLVLTFVKACSDLLASHHRSVIVVGWHSNMEVF
jgi:hypothetical protein